MKRIIINNGTKYVRIQTAIWAGAIVTALCYGLTSGKIPTPRLQIDPQVISQVREGVGKLYETISNY